MAWDGERNDLAVACRRVADRGLVVGTAGNLSIRVGDQVVVTPTGGVLEELTAADMSVVDFDGELVDGDLEPTSEVPLHLDIYRSQPMASAVAHAHALASTAVSCVHDELPAIHYTILQLGGPIRVAPYATFGSEELAANVADALEGRSAALMQNHGSVAFGRTIAEACDRLELLEWHADLYSRTVALAGGAGVKARVLTDRELEAVIMQAMAKNYGTTRKPKP